MERVKTTLNLSQPQGACRKQKRWMYIASFHLETLRGWYYASDGDDADVLDADADYDDGGDDADDLPQSPPLPQHCVRV